MDTMMKILNELNLYSVALRVILSVLFGGLIGLERGYHGRAAGLRTHILVCLGAAMAALVGLYWVSVLGFNSDPLRVGAQVVSGIGFLGVGTIIIRNREQVTGLTTAAGLWATASIGLAVGIGFYWAALLAFLMVMITISILIRFERPHWRRGTYSCYVEIMDIREVKALCQAIAPYVSATEVVPAKSGLPNHVGLEFRADNRTKYTRMLELVQENDEVMVALPSQT